jgi:hypothetical protein
MTGSPRQGHPTLAELIERYRGARSYQKLADATDGVISAPRYHTYATGTLQLAPGPDKVHALATSLGVREQTVWLAVGSSIGLDIEDSDLVLNVDGLPDTVVQSLNTLVRELRANAATYHNG